MSKAVDMVEELLHTAKDLSMYSDAQIEQLSSFRAGASVLMPRDWVHVSFASLDSRQLDLYLLVKGNGVVPAPGASASYIASSLSSHSLNADEELTFSIRYNQALFAPEMIEAMMRCWETLFENFQVRRTG